jgi:hypothetical protein
MGVRHSRNLSNTAAAALILVVMPRTASAQPPQQPVVRGDVSATVGWLGVETSFGPDSHDRWSGSRYGALGAGWHWTDHLKTEVDFAASGRDRVHRSVPMPDAGFPRPVETTISRRSLGVSQQYQFFRNTFFHPHVAAGVHTTWETREDLFQPFFRFDPVTRTPRLVEDTRRDPPRTEVIVRPFVAAGFKAYVTPRAFFRSDVRVGIRRGLDEAILRLGFGFDF